MDDETDAALYFAGPDSWHYLIAPARSFPITERTIQAAALAIGSTQGTFDGIEAVYVLCDLAAAANILANAVANAIFTANAQDIFKDARTTAHLLDSLNEHSPRYKPTFCTYQAALDAMQTQDPQVMALLLIDIIRIANHIADYPTNEKPPDSNPGATRRRNKNRNEANLFLRQKDTTWPANPSTRTTQT